MNVDICRSDYYKKSGKAMLPVRWMPPEALLNGMFTTKTDVWYVAHLLTHVLTCSHAPLFICSAAQSSVAHLLAQSLILAHAFSSINLLTNLLAHWFISSIISSRLLIGLLDHLLANIFSSIVSLSDSLSVFSCI